MVSMVGTMKGRYGLAATILLSLSSNNPHHYTTDAFNPAIINHHRSTRNSSSYHPTTKVVSSLSPLKEAKNHYDNDNTNPNDEKHSHPLSFKKFRKHLIINPITLSFLSAATSSSILLNKPQAALAASAPVTPIKQFKAPDMKEEALKRIREERNQISLKEAMAHQVKCEEIEAEQGKEARMAYESKFNAEKERVAQQKAFEKKKLLYTLAEKGICPYCDVEGVRQVYLMDHDIDLNFIPSTPQQREQSALRRTPKLADLREKQRFIVKCIVQDVMAKGYDPLQYLEKNVEKTSEIFALKERQIDNLVERYKSVISTKGTLSGIRSDTPFSIAAAIGTLMPTTATSAVVENITKTTTVIVDDAKNEAQRLKTEAKEAKQKAKEAAKVNAARLKAKAQAQKEAAKENAARLKAKAKAQKEAAKVEAAKVKAQLLAENEAAKVEAARVQQALQSTDDEDDASVDDVLELEEESVENENDQDSINENVETAVISKDDDSKSVSSSKTSSSSIVSNIPFVPVITVVGAAGGGVAFKVIKDKNAASEKEKERQFKLLMGINDDDDEDEATDDDDDDDEDDISSMLDTPSPMKAKASVSEKAKVSPPTQPAPIETPTKKRRSFKSVFSKKSSSTRETNIQNLVSDDAVAPELATLLVKILQFGAPGRFPMVSTLPGDMPLEEFDLEKAKALLVECRENSGVSNEEAAEVFASVVNCMIIDIVDLASSSLSMKDAKNKVIVDALNVVMTFMDHAAGLFDAVADNVVITPVTYSGSLGKSKLEKMFTIYASSMMTSLDGSVTQERVDTLQQVFNINDKKAEGLIQKGMMKNIMEMMKNGGEGMEGMEGLSEMMAAMGGEGGLPNFGADGDIDPEDLKASLQMMKDLVESGSVSKEELDVVRKQFKEVYGSDISELIENADKDGSSDELGKDGKELLDLFKTILKED